MRSPGGAPASPKLMWIQALRGLAALTVAAVHLNDGFARFLDDRLGLVPRGDQLAQAAVALFFVISGCVMVISSGRMAGSVRGMGTFWRRRAVRVLPPYWVATGVMVAVALWLTMPLDVRDVAASLAFVPLAAPPGSPAPFALYLWPAWTLFYELIFYAIFGACLVLGRKRAAIACAAALVALVTIAPPLMGDTLAVHAATRPVMLLFIGGLAAGLAVSRAVPAVPMPARLAALVMAGAVFVLAPHPETRLGYGWLLWAGLPALLVFVAAMGWPLHGFARRMAGTLGDASYALYLLHIPFAHAWMRVFDGWLGGKGGSIGYLAGGLPLLVIVSIAFHRVVERPLTAALNRAAARLS
ncbi:acyltransferase family protein [Altererythrobacter aerius]|uniref:Acyltransferase family protein n=1 Tax=Tsuneonella aeria TaxID=1837929 RepID=A0A6I4TDA8_9SPHN|nr:acyltransferase [Tsuneonella aeria]MXO75043.1 acyltransferase family protein [Tsuneonella aeria]